MEESSEPKGDIYGNNKEFDEFGDTNIFSDGRLAKLKLQANDDFVIMSNIIKKSEAALAGITEFLRVAELNEREFYSASKKYITTLKAIESENNKCKF